MSTRSSPRNVQMRQRLALEAARIIDEEGIHDFHAAKRKAAQRLSAVDTHNLPSNAEIEQALADYQRLFKSASQPRRLRELRESALQAMHFLASFQPRLVGSVLSGTAHKHSDVNLHVFTDTPEEIAWLLLRENIDYATSDRKLRIAGDDTATYPVYRFTAGDAVIDLTVFTLDGLRQAPTSTIDGRPMRRANLSTVNSLLQEQN